MSDPRDTLDLDDVAAGHPVAEAELAALRARVAQLEAALSKVNDIRNSIIGTQNVNWSEHIYPLVAALNDAGIVGIDWPEARARIGTLIERAETAEARVAKLEASNQKMMDRLIPSIEYVEGTAVGYGEDEIDRLFQGVKDAHAAYCHSQQQFLDASSESSVLRAHVAELESIVDADRLTVGALERVAEQRAARVAQLEAALRNIGGDVPWVQAILETKP